MLADSANDVTLASNAKRSESQILRAIWRHIYRLFNHKFLVELKPHVDLIFFLIRFKDYSFSVSRRFCHFLFFKDLLRGPLLFFKIFKRVLSFQYDTLSIHLSDGTKGFDPLIPVIPCRCIKLILFIGKYKRECKIPSTCPRTIVKGSL